MAVEHEKFMRAALSEARRGVGLTSPNPAVGAVLVRGGRIIARGYHRRPGAAHAEIACLRQVRGKLGASDRLYVTLEPCCTRGRTPPCTEAIIAAGIRHVIVGARDPNPQHWGRGFGLLRQAGITVSTGVLEEECTALNEAFNKWVTTGLPLVIAKCGMSIDGRLTRAAGEDRWITTPASRRDALQLRRSVDAILIGAETLRQDNPRLTSRGTPKARQPWRVVVTRSGRLPHDARLFTDSSRARTLVLRQRSLTFALRDLGARQITSVLIEGGGDVLGQALDERVVDKVQIYVGAMFTGGKVFAFAGRGRAATSDAARLAGVSYHRIGNDVRITGSVRYPDNSRE